MSLKHYPYTIRPGKFVDRGLFVELLQHVDRFVAMRDAVYIGFGGPSMEDHRFIYAALGLRKMVSIENDDHVFQQQKFNRPLVEIACIHRDAKDFIDEFEAELARIKIKSTQRRIIWFDYEAPSGLIHQLQALQSLIDLANDGDVIRITVNAHAGSLGNSRERESETELQKRRLEVLKKRFGDFLPDGVGLEATQNANYPAVVLNAIKLAALRATGKSNRTFLPLLIVHYADGQSMLTITGVVLPDDEVNSFLERTKLNKWPYYANEWTNVERVFKAPHLTTRERLHMDQALVTRRNKLPARLRYLAEIQGGSDGELVRLYRRYQRFFPKFQHVDI